MKNGRFFGFWLLSHDHVTEDPKVGIHDPLIYSQVESKSQLSMFNRFLVNKQIK